MFIKLNYKGNHDSYNYSIVTATKWEPYARNLHNVSYVFTCSVKLIG